MIFILFIYKCCLLFNLQETIDEYDTPAINISRIKPEMIEEDEYEHDSVYESHIPYLNDISIKSECPDYDEDYDDNYFEEVEPHQMPNAYTFRPNETVTVDVVVNGNNSAQCVSSNHNDDISIAPVII